MVQMATVSAHKTPSTVKQPNLPSTKFCYIIATMLQVLPSLLNFAHASSNPNLLESLGKCEKLKGIWNF